MRPLPRLEAGVCPEALGSCALSSPRGYAAASVFRPQPDHHTASPERGSVCLSTPRACGPAAELAALLEGLLARALCLELFPGCRVPVRVAVARLGEGEDPFLWMATACAAALLHSGLPMRGLLAPASLRGRRRCFLVLGRRVALRGGRATKEGDARVEEVYSERGAFPELLAARGGAEGGQSDEERTEELRAAAAELLDHILDGLLK